MPIVSRRTSRHRHTTYSGRIVYDRPKHVYTWADAIRVLRSLRVEDMKEKDVLGFADFLISLYFAQIRYWIRRIDSPAALLIAAKDNAVRLVAIVIDLLRYSGLTVAELFSELWGILKGFFHSSDAEKKEE